MEAAAFRRPMEHLPTGSGDGTGQETRPSSGLIRVVDRTFTVLIRTWRIVELSVGVLMCVLMPVLLVEDADPDMIPWLIAWASINLLLGLWFLWIVGRHDDLGIYLDKRFPSLGIPARTFLILVCGCNALFFGVGIGAYYLDPAAPRDRVFNFLLIGLVYVVVLNLLIGLRAASFRRTSVFLWQLRWPVMALAILFGG